MNETLASEVNTPADWTSRRRYFADDDDLYKAIGRVVVESALLDELLRELLCEVLGPATSDDVWLLFEGQSTEWLVSWNKILLDHVDPYFRQWSEAHHTEMACHLAGVDQLRVLRNTAVHGVWTYLGTNDPEDILPRPWGGKVTDRERTYVCARSRHRSIFEARLFMVADVNRLADEIEQSCLGLRDKFRLMQSGKPEPLPRW